MIGNASQPPEKPESPVYVDRITGTSFDNPFDLVNTYLSRYGERMGLVCERLDATGYAQLKRGSAYLGINVLEDTGVLMILAPIMEVPFLGQERLFRKLLELSFLSTSDAAFSIDGKKDVIYVRALRRLSSLDYEEFEDLVQTVGKVADEWDDKLNEEFGPGM